MVIAPENPARASPRGVASGVGGMAARRYFLLTFMRYGYTMKTNFYYKNEEIE
jgi:hypothetical protein